MLASGTDGREQLDIDILCVAFKVDIEGVPSVCELITVKRSGVTDWLGSIRLIDCWSSGEDDNRVYRYSYGKRKMNGAVFTDWNSGESTTSEKQRVTGRSWWKLIEFCALNAMEELSISRGASEGLWKSMPWPLCETLQRLFIINLGRHGIINAFDGENIHNAFGMLA